MPELTTAEQIKREVMNACLGYGKYSDYYSHATTWDRGGSRNDVPILCGRCATLIAALEAVEASRSPKPTD